MARKQVYLLIAKVGLSRDEQLALIRRTVGIGEQQQIYEDNLPELYRRRERGLEQRELAIEQLRKGDSIVIATPGCLGSGRDDVRDTMTRLAKLKCSVIVASTGKTVLWSDAVADGVEFLDAATFEKKRWAAGRARQAARKSQKMTFKLSDAEILVKWQDPVRYTKREVALIAGCHPKTLFNRFGERVKSATKRGKRK